MFCLFARKVVLEVSETEVVTSGSVNVYQCQFHFDNSWVGLEKTAVFQAGEESVSIILDEAGSCTIPWEVLQSAGRALYAGVYGTKNGNVVLPTIWARLGTIKKGVGPTESGQPPTPSLYEQILAQIGNLDELSTESKDSLVSAINEIYATGGGGGGGSGGTGNVFSPDIDTIRVLTLAEYQQIESPDERTEYHILG